MRNPIVNAVRSIQNNPRHILFALFRRMPWLVPNDRLYLKLFYFFAMGKKLDLENPKTFNEKIQWLKLYNRKPEYRQLVNKLAVKEYVSSLLGQEYVIPTIAVWDRPEDINWAILPKQFVLKTNHDGGGNGVVICKDKDSLDKKQAIRELKKSFKRDVYKISREWPYKDIEKKVFAEQYIEDKNGELTDYKFSCFGGKAKNVMVCCGRSSGNTQFYFFDKQWNLLRINKRGMAVSKEFSIPKPEGIDKMFLIAEILSQDMPYSRIDLFNVDGHIYFGEITFFPSGGTDSNLLPETDRFFGKMIKLPIDNVTEFV